MNVSNSKGTLPELGRAGEGPLKVEAAVSGNEGRSRPKPPRLIRDRSMPKPPRQSAETDTRSFEAASAEAVRRD